MKKLSWQTWLALTFLAAGFTVIGLAWNGASSVDFTQGQIPYLISGGATGLGLIALGGGLLMFESGRRARIRIESRMDELIIAVRESGASANGEVKEQVKGVQAKEALQTAAANGMVVVGRSSFHRPDCRLVSGKEELDFATPDEARARGLSPCRVCDPLGVETKAAAKK
jgi:hypothetical protein